MKRHPSIRRNLMVGTGLFATLVLTISLMLIYQSISRMLYKEVKLQLIESASILSKSSELEPTGVVYEWHEALESDANSSISGYFQFWDLKSGESAGSPALGGQSLVMFYGDLNQSVLREITLPDGGRAMAVGLQHLPFLDAAGSVEMKEDGNTLNPSNFPQVLVCARGTAPIEEKLGRMKFHLARAGIATISAIWLSIFLITRWTMRPIESLAGEFEKRSREEVSMAPEIPADLPVELRDLAEAFNRTLAKVEAARDRERDFALHAAHELRTPVAGIQATLEQALHRERTAEDLRARIGSALTVTEGMSGVIGSLMKLARARGRLELPERTNFSAATRVHELVNQEDDRLALRGLYLDWVGASETMVSSDVELFSVVVGILLDNVIRHAPADSMVIFEFKEEQGNLVLSVENDCADLDAGDLPRLFEPFQRGGDQSEEGAGLGLSLARETALLLGGGLTMNLLGKRLRMEFTIPLR